MTLESARCSRRYKTEVSLVHGDRANKVFDSLTGLLGELPCPTKGAARWQSRAAYKRARSEKGTSSRTENPGTKHQRVLHADCRETSIRRPGIIRRRPVHAGGGRSIIRILANSSLEYSKPSPIGFKGCSITALPDGSIPTKRSVSAPRLIYVGETPPRLPPLSKYTSRVHRSLTSTRSANTFDCSGDSDHHPCQGVDTKVSTLVYLTEVWSPFPRKEEDALLSARAIQEYIDKPARPWPGHRVKSRHLRAHPLSQRL